MKRVTVVIEGTQPLLMHNSASVDITNPMVRDLKALLSKSAKKRTDDDEAKIAFLSFSLAIYHNANFVYIPDVVILGCIVNGAKSVKKGKEAKVAVDCEETEIPLIYEGPQDIKKLYEQRFVDVRPVVVSRQRIMRVRPRFNEWALQFNLLIDVSVMSPDAVKNALVYAGERVGICDFRPRFGRFILKEWKEVA